MISIDQLIDEIIVREGGDKYTNDPNDKGGPTKFGITQSTLSKYLNKPCTPMDVQNLSRELAEEIYKDEFFVHPKINQLPDLLQSSVMDAGVMSSPSRAIKLLQDVLNMAGFPCGTDGIIGPTTRKQAFTAFEQMGGFLINAYAERRVHFYQFLASNEGTNDPDKKYEHGWIDRANKFRVNV